MVSAAARLDAVAASRVFFAACVAVVAALAACALALRHPIAPWVAAVACASWLATAAWRPSVWLFVVPASLPFLDFGPWSGWVAYDEFDLLLLGTIAGWYLRFVIGRLGASAREPTNATITTNRRGAWERAVLVGCATAFVVCSALAFIRGGGWAVPSFDGQTAYAAPLAAWRVGKSLLYAGLLWPALRADLANDRPGAIRRLSTGMWLGTAVVVCVTCWERVAYPGFGDYDLPYRTVALFWEMHVGGAAIDAYLALALPFVGWALWTARTRARWWMAAGLAAVTVYALLMTFSRGAYAAVALSGLGLGGVLWLQAAPAQRRDASRTVACVSIFAAATLAVYAAGAWTAALCMLTLAAVALLADFPYSRRVAPSPAHARAAVLALALVCEVAVVLHAGSYARARLATSPHDLNSRWVHWGAGLGLLRGPADGLLGLGLGQLPDAYAGQVPIGEFPGTVRYLGPSNGTDGPAMQLLGPATRQDLHGRLALTQRVALPSSQGYRLVLSVRTPRPTDLLVELCEQHLLFPRGCQVASMHLQDSGSALRRINLDLLGPDLDRGMRWAPRLGVLSIAVVNTGGAAEITHLDLRGLAGAPLLLNPDFTSGPARWFPVAYGDYLPWHIDNLYLELAIERGWPALLAFLGFVGVALRRLLGADRRQACIAPFLAASLLGGLAVGGVGSLMDMPRVAFLFWLLLLTAVALGRPSPRHGASIVTR